MTVQNTTVKDIYVGNGATTKFPITFQMTDHPEYIKVYITGDDSVAVETENFSVDLGAKTVTYPANGDPLPDGHKITIYRELPLYQLMNLVNQGPFFAENIELSFDDLTFICQQLNEKLNRTLSAGIDVSNFNNTFPVKAGMSFRINDAGDGLVLTEDPARVLPLAKDVLEQTKQVKESAVNETTNIKNTAIEELTAIKDTAVNETTEIKDEAVAAKNTAVEAAATAAEDAAQKTVENITAEIDSKVAAAEDSKKAAAQSASSAADSMKAAQTSKEAAKASANSASSSATTAIEQADRAQGIADNLEGLAGITGIATTEEAIAGVVDNKTMTPLKTKEAVAAQNQGKADLVDGKVPAEQLPEINDIPIGFIKFNPLPIIENGWVNASLGTLTQRELYADLWAWVEQHPELLKTEAEWQAIEAANEGHVPFYSSGDGTTTFRLPKFLWYPCATDDTQKYGNFATDTQRNITGTLLTTSQGGSPFSRNQTGIWIDKPETYVTTIPESSDPKYSAQTAVDFDASKSVGAEHTGDTVKPKTHYGCYVVKAYGTVTNTGNIDVQQVVATQSVTEGRVTLLEDNKANKTDLSMPDGNKILQLNITASGQSYSAPVDGWAYCRTTKVTAGQWIIFVVDDKYAVSNSNLNINGNIYSMIPVKQNSIVRFDFVSDSLEFYFIPAVSAK